MGLLTLLGKQLKVSYVPRTLENVDEVTNAVWLIHLCSVVQLDRDATVLVLGLNNSGKTTMLKKISDECISHTMAIQGFNIGSLMDGGFKLNVWDIGGETISSTCTTRLTFAVQAQCAFLLSVNPTTIRLTCW